MWVMFCLLARRLLLRNNLVYRKGVAAVRPLPVASAEYSVTSLVSRTHTLHPSSVTGFQKLT